MKTTTLVTTMVVATVIASTASSIWLGMVLTPDAAAHEPGECEPCPPVIQCSSSSAPLQDALEKAKADKAALDAMSNAKSK